MLRLIDANLDRLGEGLRVLEDVARFLLDDAELSRQLKTLRHKLFETVYPLEQQLLDARKAGEDVGAFVKLPGEAKRTDLPQVVTANARRVQESLRVLEEFAKLPDTPLTLEPAKFEQARFSLYELEQKLLSKLLRREKAGRLAGLYLILDTQALRGRNEVGVATQAIRGGAKAIQLRDKQHSKTELLEIARRLREVCAEKEVLFIINDYLDIALATGADGLHLGQKDLPLSEAHRFLSIDKLVGCSAATLSEAVQAQAEGADYIAVGSIYPTLSKENFRLVGLKTLQQIRRKISLPLIAIGGINETNVAEVIKAGADGIAVISAVLGAEDVEGATRKLVTKLEKARSESE
ncbi:MAG TPA: thiamine phosphate synthase [Dehalococcoidia bacterium]|nr:thiamine phosphate synthase [Dehalococcoidia bacterium]